MSRNLREYGAICATTAYAEFDFVELRGVSITPPSRRGDKPDEPFALAVVPLDAPAQACQRHQRRQGRVGRQVREPRLGRRGVAVGPVQQQPLLGQQIVGISSPPIGDRPVRTKPWNTDDGSAPRSEFLWCR
jgi:hypothetical protein